MSLSANSLVKIYGTKKVVDNVSLSVNQGEIVGLLGPNGAGKTTTFYSIVGLIKPDDGEVFIDLHNVGKHEQSISPGDKIAQLVLVPVVPFRLSEKEDGNLYGDSISISKRGDGALGSTNITPQQAEAWPNGHPLNGMPPGF